MDRLGLLGVGQRVGLSCGEVFEYLRDRVCRLRPRLLPLDDMREDVELLPFFQGHVDVS